MILKAFDKNNELRDVKVNEKGELLMASQEQEKKEVETTLYFVKEMIRQVMIFNYILFYFLNTQLYQ